jgi:protein-S-isoprenylcysteine O-methyltransferase Ste14
MATGDLLAFLQTARGSLYAALFISWWGYEAVYVRLGFGGSRPDRITRAALAASWLAGTYRSVADFALSRGAVSWDLWASLGVIAFGLGLLLGHASFATLGPHFSDDVEISPSQPLMRRGRYARLRHPSYTGVAPIGLSISLLFGSLR